MKRVFAGGLAALMSMTTVVVTAGSASALPPVSTSTLNVKPLELNENGTILEYDSTPKFSYRNLTTGADLAQKGGLIRGNGRWFLDAELIRFGAGIVTEDKVIVRDLSNGTNVTLAMPATTYPGYTLIALEDLSSNGQVVLFRMESTTGVKDSRLFAWNKANPTAVELDAGLPRTTVGAAAYRGAVDAELSSDGTVAVFQYKDAIDACSPPANPGCTYDVYRTSTASAAGRTQLNVTGAGAPAPGYVGDIAISGNGNIVAWEAVGFAPGAGVGTPFLSRVYLRDITQGAATTSVISEREPAGATGQFELDLDTTGDRISYFNAANQPRVLIRSINKTIDIGQAATNMTMSDDGLWLAYGTGASTGVLVRLPVDASEPYFQKRLAAGGIVEMPIAGKTGVPGNATAAVLNVTAVGPGDSGYLTVWPCDATRPNTSSLNYTAGEDTPNLVVSKLSATGTVCVFSSAATDIIIDLNGYFPAGGDFQGITPDRKLDTRPTGKIVGGGGTEATVTGGPVPANAGAVVVNVTATGTEGPGYVTVWPCGTSMPNASTLNFVGGRDRANLAVAQVGTNGKICLATAWTTHLIVDVVGYFPAGANITPLTPNRVLDTRSGAPVAAGGIAKVKVPAGQKAVALNVTVTGAAAAGYATVWPCGDPQPNASNLNYGAGQDVPNAVIAKVGTNDEVCIFTDKQAHYIADLTATFPAASTIVPLAPIRRLDTR
jgi:hypothetical protein